MDIREKQFWDNGFWEIGIGENGYTGEDNLGKGILRDSRDFERFNLGFWEVTGPGPRFILLSTGGNKNSGFKSTKTIIPESICPGILEKYPYQKLFRKSDLTCQEQAEIKNSTWMVETLDATTALSFTSYNKLGNL